jgi:hypothetical protein
VNKKDALNLLLANAYCTNSKLCCDDCPLYESCEPLTEDNIYEAVQVISQQSESEKI